jgi:hypothetical protein
MTTSAMATTAMAPSALPILALWFIEGSKVALGVPLRPT